WKPQAKSYLIDTLIRGMPVPPIYLRMVQASKKNKVVREVVDGQQRVSTVLDYIDGKFRLSRTLDAPYAGKGFDDLEQQERDAIIKFGFISQVSQGVSDQQVLEVFARLNTYAVPLNAQELRNGNY